MANKKISELTEKTTFGDGDFLAGTQGTGAADNRKYGKAAMQAAVGGGGASIIGLYTVIFKPVGDCVVHPSYVDVTSPVTLVPQEGVLVIRSEGTNFDVFISASCGKNGLSIDNSSTQLASVDFPLGGSGNVYVEVVLIKFPYVEEP